MNVFVHLFASESASTPLVTKKLRVKDPKHTLEQLLSQQFDAQQLANCDVFLEREQNPQTRRRLVKTRRLQTILPTDSTRISNVSSCGNGSAWKTIRDFELVLVLKPSVAAGSSSLDGDSSMQTADEPKHQPAISTRDPIPTTQHADATSAAFTAVPRAKADPEECQPKQTRVTRASLELVLQHMQTKEFRTAAQLLQRLVLSSDPSNPDGLFLMGEMFFSIAKYKAALRYYNKNWQTNRCSVDRLSERDRVALVNSTLRLVRCQIHLRQETSQILATLDDLVTWMNSLDLKDSANKKQCAYHATQLKTERDPQDEIKFLKALTLYESHSPSMQDAAIDLLLGLLPSLDASDVDLEALQLYARIAHDRGRRPEALRMILRVIVGLPDDKQVKRQFVSMVKDQGTSQVMAQFKQLLAQPNSQASASAYAYLATIFKDFGAMDISIECFQIACAAQPANASYALNLAHALEVVVDDFRVYRVLLEFCQRNGDTRVGPLRASAIVGALAIAGWDAPLDSKEEWAIEWNAQSSSALVYERGSLWNGLDVNQVATRSSADATSYNHQELDLLACFFTLVKVLFLNGRLHALPRLIALLEPVRKDVALHLTSIRNEHAYYACIAQLISFSTKEDPEVLHMELAVASTAKEIFVCGDSHTLPTSWRHLSTRNGRIWLRPALVTGLKHWHLREDSWFYPKVNFFKMLQRIPPHSTVIFLFGEIDCREGIVCAVNQLKYKSLEQGMRETVAIYMKVLQQVVTQFHFEAFLHPIVPVLDETRAIVVTYNRILQDQVRKSSFCRWLDFFESLLCDNKLRETYRFDGSHLHPRYLTLLQQALDQHGL